LPPRPSPQEFAEAILGRDVEQYDRHSTDARVFFDRGVLDALCMLVDIAPTRREEYESIASRYPYYGKVFVLPPWEAIFTTDEERDQTFGEAVRVHERLIAWYRRCGYQMCEVPRVSVDERCEHVLSALPGGH
jgi:predicted ATPase